MTQVPPMPPQPPMPQGTPGTAVGSLICGISSLVVDLMAFCCGLAPLLGLGLAVAALLLARTADHAISLSGGALGGAGLVQAGRITGYIGLALNILLLVMVIAMLIFAVGMGALGPRRH